MPKVYIINRTNYEYNDEYFYVSGDIAPSGYYTSKKEAYKELVDIHRREYIHSDTFSQFALDNEDLCSNREQLRIDLGYINSFIEVPDFDPDSYDNSYEWIPKTLTFEETEVLMRHMINFASIMELPKK